MAALPLPLADLTLPRQDTLAVRSVLNAYLRELARHLVQLSPSELSPAVRPLFARTQARLARLVQSEPRRVVPLLRQPTLAAPLLTAWRHLHLSEERDQAALDAWVRELCLLLHLELAPLGLADETPIPRGAASWPRLHAPSLGYVLALAPEVDEIAFTQGQLHLRRGEARWSLPLADAAAWPADAPVQAGRPYARVADGILLAESDNNPLSMFEAHPDKHGNQVSLGGHAREEWLESLRSAVALVDEHLPLIGEELRLVVRLIVPVGYDAERHLSASYQEAVGTIYMTLHPNPLTMTEALVHEFQHNKLNAQLNVEPLLHNAFFPLYTSPVRPDPRPLHGVLLAVHAFQPVAALYEQLQAKGHPLSRTPFFRRRFRDILRMNRAGAATVLGHAQPTRAGEGLLAEMRQLDARFLAYESAHWTEAAQGEAPALPE